MKKNVIKIFFLFFILLVLSLSILSTIGIKTEKFNNFLLQQVKQSSKNIDIKLDYIKFKLDIFELSLYLETFDSKISYDQIILPTQKIRVYIDFISLIKTKPQVKKIYLGLDEINIDELKNLNFEFMSYNLKNFIQNKIKKGNIASEFDLYFETHSI